LLGLLEPGFDLRVISLLALVVLHFAEQELSFELFARQFFDELTRPRSAFMKASSRVLISGLNSNLCISSSLVFGEAIAIGVAVLKRAVFRPHRPRNCSG
jgi:hypothetical protein